jgi:hypothetical protein
VEDDYIVVMPLPVKRKYFISYLTQPYNTQQLGIFSHERIMDEKITEFIKRIPFKFIIQRLNFNYANHSQSIKAFTYLDNYELNLNRSYSEIYKNYNADYNARKLKLVDSNQFLLAVNADTSNVFIESYRVHSNKPLSSLEADQLKDIIEYSLPRNIGELYVVRNLVNEVIAGAFFLVYFKRIYYLVSFSSAEGKKSSAMFWVMDKVIQKYAGTEMILDFEGSILPGVAKFMKGWGSELVKYPQYCKGFF